MARNPDTTSICSRFSFMLGYRVFPRPFIHGGGDKCGGTKR